MELNKGLWKDNRDSKVPLGSWVQARNILLSQKFRSIVAEPGFISIAPLVGTIIGTIVCPDYVIYHIKDVGVDKIVKVFPDETTEVIIDTTVHTGINLNYQLDKPIEGIFKINNLGEVIICWTDNYNPIRILNVDTVTTSFTTSDLLFYPELVNNIEFDISIEDNTGNVEVGNHSFVCRLINNLEIPTNWLTVSKPIFITTSQASNGYDAYCGSAYTISSKSIILDLTNIDTKFKSIQIAVISKVNGITKVKTIFDRIITGTSQSFKYTGIESIDENISLNDVLIPNINYSTCKTLTQVNNQLCIGNLNTKDILNYQKYANNIKIDYVSEIKNVTSLSAGSATGSSKIIELNHKDRSWMHREVVSFYIAFKLLDGSYSKAFHIPGRRAVSTETNNSGITGYPVEPKNYQVRDTADTVGASTNMGYWENKNEFYPIAANDPNGDFEVWDSSGKIDDIQGENVRHHRFPSIKHIESLGLFGADYRKTEADILGIAVTDVYIPTEIKSQILGWEIFYAERNYENCTVMGQDFLVNAGQRSGVRYNLGIGYAFTDNFGLQTGIGYENTFVHSRCPDLLKDKPSVNPQYLALELFYTLSTTRTRSILNSGSYDFENISVDYTGQYSAGDTVTITDTSTLWFKRVVNSRYVAANTLSSPIDNRLGDEFIEYELSGPSSVGPTTFEINTGVTAIPDHNSALYSIMQLKDDIYVGFNNYFNLVGTGVVFDKNATSSSNNIFGGDIFIVDHCSVRYGVGYTDLFYTGDNHENLHHFIRGILNCTNNWSLRHIDEDDLYTWYYPKKTGWTPGGGFGELDKNNPINILYNTDFTAINNKNVISVYDFKNQDITKFPFRIARTNAVSNENSQATWGTFLANNYYDMPRHKGEVWKLEEMGTSLLINQKNSFYVAKLKDKLTTDIAEIYVGMGDIFDRPPQENIPIPLGYAGCQSQFGTVLTKHGYIFIDVSQGKVFLYNGNLIELSNKGMYDWFYNIFPTTTTDNPYTQNGVCCTFDEKFNRLIIGVRHSEILGGPYPELDLNVIYNVGDIITDGVNLYIVVDSKTKPDINYYPEDLQIDVLGTTQPGYAEKIYYGDSQYYNNSKSFTISYSFDFQCWVCEHDYLPNYMYYTRNGVYSVLNSYQALTYKFNASPQSGIYYTAGVTYPSSIDVPFIFKEPVILNSVRWKSDIKLNISSQEKWIENETIDSIAIYNKNQCTGIIVLSDKTPSRYSNTLRRNTKGLWSFNNFRDIIIDHNEPFVTDNGEFITANLNNNQSYYKLLPLINDYFIVRFKYNNTINEFKEWYLNDVDVLITPIKKR